MTFATILASLIRTIVPVVVGAILTFLISLGIVIDDSVIEFVVTAAISTVITAIYYVLIRYLETFKSSKWGWLLGKAAAPVYPTVVGPILAVAEVRAATKPKHAAPNG